MKQSDACYKAYLAILKRELMPVAGCTEPAALAFAAAKAREALGEMPQRVVAEVSGNIIKNTKSVIVPNTNGMSGIAAAVAAGLIAQSAAPGLQILSQLKPADVAKISECIKTHEICVTQAKSDLIFDICITVFAGENSAKIRICNEHANVVHIEKNGAVLLSRPIPTLEASPEKLAEEALLNIKDIIKFADSVEIADVSETIERQITFNSAISAEGLSGSYGANIGKYLLASGEGVAIRAKAHAAAASDARMSGCNLPVVILSGSGNQGITASLPVVEYAKSLNVGHEKLIRALVLSDLATLHQKRYIGRLSAYCGAVCAGAACGAGIAYLHGGGYDEISRTIINALAIVSGMVCDGAKASCAAKIAMSVEAGIMGYFMHKSGGDFPCGEGIVKRGIEKTIQNVGVLGAVGMRATDDTILQIMLEDDPADCSECVRNCANAGKNNK